jgi:uncharacterized protein YuzE
MTHRRYGPKRNVTGPDDHGSVYVYYVDPEKRRVKHTFVLSNATVVADYDKNGDLFGIEVLGVSAKKLPKRKKA